MAIDDALGERIRAARTGKGWKQKHLAARLSVEPVTVSRWERGATTPDLDVLRLVAQETGKPLSYFVDSTEGSAAPSALDEAVGRIEAAADRIATESGRIADALEALRKELASAR